MRLQRVAQILKRRWRWLSLALVLVVIIIAVRIISQPVQGHTTPVDVQLSHDKAKPVPVIPASQAANKYYKLSVPAGYHAQPGTTSVAGLLYSQQLTKPGALGSLVIGIAVKTMPVGGLTNDSSYRLRVQEPARYLLSSQKRGGQTITVAVDNQDTSVTAFWPHGSYLATVGISSSIDNPGSDELSDELRALTVLLNGWQWQ